MPSATTNFRSPSPAFPGAWPRTSLRSRSFTCPTSSSGPDSMQANLPSSHTVPVRLASLSSDETLAPSATFCSAPSEDSQLSRFTPLISENSLSTLTDLSVDTSTSTLEEADAEPKPVPSDSETRIQQLPSPATSPDSSYVAYNRRTRDDISDMSISSEFSFRHSPASNHTPSPQSPGSPISPMIFVSGSNRPTPVTRRLRAGDQSHSFTSIEDGEYDDSNLLRLGSPSFASSAESLAMSSPRVLRRQDVSVIIVSPMSEGYTSSTERLEAPSQVQLTSLSLPGSLNSEDSFPDAASLAQNTETGTPWTLSLSGYSEHDLSPSVTSPISIPMSPSPSLRAQLEIPLATHAVTFPSPTSSTSPAQPSITILTQAETALDTNATEYATAVMSSSWDSSALQIEPMGQEFTCLAHASARDHPVGGTLDIAEHERRTNQPQRKRGILSRMKKFGVKVKHILQGKSKELLADEISSSKETTANANATSTPIRAISNDTVAAQQPSTPPTLELQFDSFDLERHLDQIPLSSGPLTRSRKSRPSITAQTYAGNSLSQSDVRADSAHADPEPAFPSDGIQDAIPGSAAFSPTEEMEQQLQICARPKTLDEIKNRRRLSLSAISNHLARPSSPSGVVGPSTPVAVRPRKPRPASALILPSMSPPSPQVLRQSLNRVSILPPIGPVYRRSYGMYPLPPGLDTSPRARTVRLDVPEGDSRPASGRSVGSISSSRHPRQDQERNRNQNRFSFTTSLSTLSDFATGLVEHGSWAKFDSRRGDSS